MTQDHTSQDTPQDTPDTQDGSSRLQSWVMEVYSVSSDKDVYIFNLPHLPEVTVAAPSVADFAAFLEALASNLLPPGWSLASHGVTFSEPEALEHTDTPADPPARKLKIVD